jgi:hypothetical protein
MKSVFILWHTHQLPHGGEDDKLVGVYESRAEAELAQSRVNKLPGFAKYPSGFHVQEHELGRDTWVEGFVSV